MVKTSKHVLWIAECVNNKCEYNNEFQKLEGQHTWLFSFAVDDWYSN